MLGPGISWSHCGLWQVQGGASSGSLPLTSLLSIRTLSPLCFSLLWSLAFPQSGNPHSVALFRQRQPHGPGPAFVWPSCPRALDGSGEA